MIITHLPYPLNLHTYLPLISPESSHTPSRLLYHHPTQLPFIFSHFLDLDQT
uniref:Uncharacterized protein n=1 Tax=Meloidogyne enterolobii TaxID=390850 RepID=A0A6V7V154_MELEN|nr:unnamed protein product [Meloidogyne enterolobii]